MTLPPVIRIFFAVDLPDETKKQLGKLIGQLKKRSKSHAIRWTRPENLHITLQFLAEAHSEHLPTLLTAVRAAIAGVFNTMPLNFGALHLFPNPYRPRVIVLDVLSQEPLAMLSGLIGQCITELGYETETRPFRAHLTLGRIKHPQGLDMSFLAEHAPTDVHGIEVSAVTLFRSEPQPQGSMYSVLETIGLS